MVKETTCEECGSDLSEDETCPNCSPVSEEKKKQKKICLKKKNKQEKLGNNLYKTMLPYFQDNGFFNKKFLMPILHGLVV